MIIEKINVLMMVIFIVIVINFKEILMGQIIDHKILVIQIKDILSNDVNYLMEVIEMQVNVFVKLMIVVDDW